MKHKVDNRQVGSLFPALFLGCAIVVGCAGQRIAFGGEPDLKDGGYSVLLTVLDPAKYRLPSPQEAAKYPTFMPSIPLEKNAARYYMMAILLTASENEEIPAGSGSSAEPFEGDMAAFQAWVERNRSALTAVHEATQAGTAEYPMLINTKTGDPTMVGAPAQLRKLARTCADAGFLEELKGGPDAAAEWYMMCVRIGTQNRTGVILNSLVSCALCGIGRAGLNALIANAPVSDESLRKAIAVCRAAESTPGQVLDALRRQKEFLDASTAATGPETSTADRQFAVQQSQALERLKDRLAGSLPEFLATEALRAQAKSDDSGYSRWRIELGRMDFGLRATRLRAAIVLYQRKSGKLPDNLDALCPDILPEVPLDPFSGKPVRYAITDQGWKLWSVGEDMKDDGGTADINQKLGNIWGPNCVILSGVRSELERRSWAWQSLSLPSDEWQKAVDAMVARKTPMPSAFHDGVRKNDKAAVERLLAAGADLNAKDWEGRTPLHLAVIGGHADLVDFLLTRGADLAATDNGVGLTPLHYAANLGSRQIIALLLDKGADLNAKAGRNQTPLHLAATPEAVDLLLAKKADVNAPDKQGRTPLYWASARGRLALAEQLIKGGADVRAKDKGLSTPLHAAAEGGHVKIAKLLLASGAELHARTKQDLTPVIAACSSFPKNKEMVEFLVSKGADANDELYVGIQEKDIKRVKAALARGAQPGGVLAYGYTPLTAAMWLDSGKTIVELLLDKGADVNDTDEVSGGGTALSYAVSCDQSKDIISLLLDRGARPNVLNLWGGTLLHSAVGYGRLEVVQLLVAKGADVNAKDKDGATPLQIAVKEGRAEIAKFLREHGAKE